jgi:Putative adhesin
MRTNILHAATYSLALLAATTSWANNVVDKQFAVQPGELLVIDTDAGSIDIVGSDDAQVSMHAAIDGSREAIEGFTINATHEDGVVKISGRRSIASRLDLSQWFGGLKVKYSIGVPRSFKLQIKTSGGNLDFRKIQGSVKANTSGGNVRLEDIDGDIDIHTSGGGMQSERTQGQLRLRTSGGPIAVRNAHGNSDLGTSGGNINLTDIEGNLRAHTSGGNIDVSLRGEQSNTELRTSGGNITISMPSTFAINIDAHTSGGRIRSDIPVTTSGDLNQSSLSGSVNGGGPNTLMASTSGGNISIKSSQNTEKAP